MLTNLDDAINAYDNLFLDDTYPGFMMLQQYNEIQNITIIQECIDKNKTVYELGYIEEAQDFDY